MTEILLERAPKEWPTKRLGQLFRERKEIVNDRDFPALSVTKQGIVPQLETAAKSDDSDNRKGVHAGDFVINSRSDRKGSGGLADLTGSVSLINIVLEPRAIHPRFAHHLLRCSAFQEEFYRWGHGIVADLWTTRFADMKSIRLAIPDVAGQKAIASFLDRETARIDQLVAKKEQQILLLAERANVIVHDAASHPDAVLSKLGHHIQIEPGYAFGSEDFKAEDGIRLLRGVNVAPGFIRWDDVVYWPTNRINEVKDYLLNAGDVVFGMDRPWVSAGIRVAEITESDLPSLLLQRVCRITSSRTLDKGYLRLILSSPQFKAYFEPIMTGVSVPHISAEQIAGFRFALLPIEMQRSLAHETQTSLAHLRELSSAIEASIELLQKRRAALITAAVTGQIETRANYPVVTSKSDRARFRVIVGTEIIHRHQNNPKFGRVKLQKVLYLAEAHVGISELQGNYERRAAGPFDDVMIDETERALEAEGYYRKFQPVGAGTAVTYRPLVKAGQHADELAVLLGARVDGLHSLIALLRDLDKEAVEAIATLYAVWNDALMDGQHPNDAAIVSGVLTEWHAEKELKFRKPVLQTWLAWMKRQGLIPRGQGPRARHTAPRDMFA